MKKSELIDQVVVRTGAPKKEVARIVDATFAEIIKTLAGNEKVVISTFGTFKPCVRLPYDYYSPQKQAHCYSPEVYRVKFEAGTVLKDRVASIPVEEDKKVKNHY